MDHFSELPKALGVPFSIIGFDWDGTAVVNRGANACELAKWMLPLLEQGVILCVITGTHVFHLSRQLLVHLPMTLPSHRLYFLTNRGSEVFGVDSSLNPFELYAYRATDEQNLLLDDVAETVVKILKEKAKGLLPLEIIYNRLNRRKIDLIPDDPIWQDPPKEKIGELLKAVDHRLHQYGIEGGLKEAMGVAQTVAKIKGFYEARITTDVKHIEVGLTDKSDSVAWILTHLAEKLNIPHPQIVFAGDEFGPVGGFEGSDARMITPASTDCCFFSVGPEPNGVPPPVLHLKGGVPQFLRFLQSQIALHKKVNG